MTNAELTYRAKNALRVDNDENDEIIAALCEAFPSYIEVTTGYPIAQQDNEPLIMTVFDFIMRVWYYADHADDVKLSRTIDNLLKCITLKANAVNRAAAANAAE